MVDALVILYAANCVIVYCSSMLFIFCICNYYNVISCEI